MIGNNLAYSEEKMYCPPTQGLCYEDKKNCAMFLGHDEKKCYKVKS